MTEKRVKFGWCTTNQHDQCRKQYIDWVNTQMICSCECHTKEDK
jgi:hypothetical protein